ncbi:aminoacyl-tRNA deacylase [Candidatus Margulisiibacteriota bacterium]
MAVYKRLKEFLVKNKIKYEAKRHKEVFTAQEVAAVQHVSGDAMAKVVIVKSGNKMGMLVLPASHRVDFKKVKQVLGTGSVKLATEKEFKDAFPDCEVGAMPPFGSFYSIPVLADKALGKSETIVFRAGSHKDTVKMKLGDYAKLEKPVVVDFSIHL